MGIGNKVNKANRSKVGLAILVIIAVNISLVSGWDVIRECRLSAIDKQSKVISRGHISYLRSGDSEINLEIIKNGKERDFITGRLQGCNSPRSSKCLAQYEGFRVNDTISDDLDNDLPAEFSDIDSFGQWMRLRLGVSQRNCRKQYVTFTIDQCVNKNIVNTTSGCSNVDLTDIARGINRTIELELITLENIRATNTLLGETKNSVIARADVIESSINLMLVALGNVSTTALTTYNSETTLTVNNYITNITTITNLLLSHNDTDNTGDNRTSALDLYVTELNVTTSAVLAVLNNLSALQQDNYLNVMSEIGKITTSITDMSSVVRVSLLLLQDIRKSMNLSLDYNFPQTDNSTILTLLNLQQQNSVRLVNIENLLQTISNYSSISDGASQTDPGVLGRWDNALQIFIASGVGATLISSVLPTVLICLKKKSDMVTQL